KASESPSRARSVRTRSLNSLASRAPIGRPALLTVRVARFTLDDRTVQVTPRPDENSSRAGHPVGMNLLPSGDFSASARSPSPPLPRFTMTEFSLQLNEDQKQLQSWVHEFADTVIRPAGEEWDEREETPWPIIQEAAKIGLYGMDFMANAMMGDPTGLTLPVT